MTDEQRKQIEDKANIYASIREGFAAKLNGVNQHKFMAFQKGAEFGLSLAKSRVKELESALTDATRILPSKGSNPYYETDIADFLKLANKLLTPNDNATDQSKP